jgi:hypothetical protein
MNTETMKSYVDEYGFRNFQVIPEEGGRITICDYRTEGDKEVDIGLFSSINPHGLGGSDYIRNQKAVDKFIGRIDRTVWINEDQKTFLKNALETFK